MARARAAHMQEKMASEADDWIAPPPTLSGLLLLLKKNSGRSSAFAYQSSIIVSSSVNAGHDACWVNKTIELFFGASWQKRFRRWIDWVNNKSCCAVSFFSPRVDFNLHFRGGFFCGCFRALTVNFRLLNKRFFFLHVKRSTTISQIKIFHHSLAFRLKVFQSPSFVVYKIFFFSLCFVLCAHPRKSNCGDSRAEHVSENRRISVAGSEVGEEVRVVPVKDSWHDFLFKVVHHFVVALRLLWHFIWRRIFYLS